VNSGNIRMHKALARSLLLLAAITPAILPLVLILKYGVNMPFWDEWSPNVAGLLIKARLHQLSLSDFLSQQNEHRIAVFRVIYLLLELATRGSSVAVMVATWLCVCITSAGLLCLAATTVPRRTLGDPWFDAMTRPRVVLPWLIANLILFSPAHWENWLWAMGLANVLPICFIVWGLVVASSPIRSGLRVFLAILLSFLAMLSYTNGLLAWPIIGVMLLWSGSRTEFKAKAIPLGVWTLACVVALSIYLLSYHSTPPPAGQTHPASVQSIISYNLAFLGNVFTFSGRAYEVATAIVLGTCTALMLGVTLAYVLHAWRRRGDAHLIRQTLVWFLIASYTLCSGLLASFFRAFLGTDQALSSRYGVFSIFALVGLVFIVPAICDDLSHRVRTPSRWRLNILMPMLLGGIVAALLLLGLPQSLDTFDTASLNRRQGKAALVLYNVLPDNPQFSTLVTNDVSQIHRLLPELNRLGYFHPPLIATPNAAELEIATPAGESYGAITAAQRVGSDAVKVEGWAIDPDRKRPADAVILTFDTANGLPLIFIMADMGAQRPDIAQALKDGRYLKCGWIVTAPLGRIPPGVKVTQIRAWAMDSSTGRLHRLEKNFTLQ
jgi:hypothetical protein